MLFNKNKFFLKKFALPTITRGFATVPGLTPDKSKYLKPEVLSILEQSPDPGLGETLNELSRDTLIKLNTATKVQLIALNSKSCERIFRELKSPWVFYWEDVLGLTKAQPDKWAEAMKEIEESPIIMDLCYKTMMERGVDFTIEHMNSRFKAYRKYLLFRDICFIFHKVNRGGIGDVKLNAESYQILLDCFLEIGWWPGIKYINSFLESKKFKPTPEQQEKIKQSKALMNEVWKELNIEEDLVDEDKFEDYLAVDPEIDMSPSAMTKRIEKEMRRKNILKHPFLALSIGRMQKKWKEFSETGDLDFNIQPPFEKLVVKNFN